ncbi:hypothetical protein CR513_52276, partial [Mucuna pruriens]
MHSYMGLLELGLVSLVKLLIKQFEMILYEAKNSFSVNVTQSKLGIVISQRKYALDFLEKINCIICILVDVL